MAGAEHLPRYFLLFAGSQPAPQGGLGDLVGAFTSEVAAREAFRQLRVSQASASSWAQLAVVDGDRGIRALSWFGIGAAPARTPVTFPRSERSSGTSATREVPSAARPDAEPTARRNLAKKAIVCLISLVALVAITIGVVSDDGTTRPVTPNPARVSGGAPANSPVVPFSVDGSAVAEGRRGADG